MTSLTLDAYAKINLSLDVISKRGDGYHELCMIMQQIELHDTVIMNASESGIQLKCKNGLVPSDSRNTACKAAYLIMKKYGIRSGLKLEIIKRIPVAAGLAGGSTDAASVIKGMNSMFSLGLGMDEMFDIGKAVGADVPYCIAGGTMMAKGIGEKLTCLPSFDGVDIVLIKPDFGVSTAWAFNNLELGRLGGRPDTNHLADALSRKDVSGVAEGMRNVLESVTIPKYPAVREAKNRLMELGALGSIMSGSGPAVFGVFKDRESARNAYREISKSGRWNCCLTRTIC